MKNKLFALSERDARQFLADSHDIKQSALKMTSAELHEKRALLVIDANVNSIESIRRANENTPLYSVDKDGSAHIPVTGMLTPKASPCDMFGGDSTEYSFIEQATFEAGFDPTVRSIIYDINSQGGHVDGVDECAQAIASSVKPTEAHVHSLCASAAYWLASQCARIVAMTPAAQVGCIGVVTEIEDSSEADKTNGIQRITLVSSHAPDKRPDVKTDEGKAVIMRELDDTENVFISRVAQGRGTTIDNVQNTYGHGSVVIASDALKAGMIDEIIGAGKLRENSSAVSGEAAVASNGAEKQEDTMAEQIQTQAQSSQALEDIAKSNFDAGVKAERTRREQLSKFLGINADGDKAVMEAIASGKSFEDANAEIQAAVLKGKTAAADGENAPDIRTQKTEHKDDYSGSTSGEDAEWYKEHGMSPDDVRKFAQER